MEERVKLCREEKPSEVFSSQPQPGSMSDSIYLASVANGGIGLDDNELVVVGFTRTAVTSSLSSRHCFAKRAEITGQSLTTDDEAENWQ